MIETVHVELPGLLVATRQGVLRFEVGGGGEPDALPFALNGTYVTCLAADAKGAILAAGSREHGLHWTKDGGKTWQVAASLASGTVVALASSGSALYAATETPALHRGQGGGGDFAPLAGLAQLWRERYPSASSEARISALYARGQRVLVASEGGTVFLSEDGGNTFREVAGALPAPVLCLCAPSGSADLVLAGTGRGLYRSGRPGSEPWKQVFTDRDRPAVTAIGAGSASGSGLPIVCGVARDLQAAKPGIPTGADAAFLRSEDGLSFAPVRVERMPVVRGRVSRVVFAPRDPKRVFAGTTAGEIFESHDGGMSFRLATATLPGVLDLSAGPALY